MLGIMYGYLLLTTVTPTIASVTYSYTGNLYNRFSTPSSYDNSMAISGTIELNAPLDANLNLESVTPLNFNFSDGLNTISSDNATFSSFKFITNSVGEITGWDFGVSIGLPTPEVVGGESFGIYGDRRPDLMYYHPIDHVDIYTCIVATAGSCNQYSVDYAETYDLPGSWSVVPVPAAIWLFGSGLLGLVGMARREKVA